MSSYLWYAAENIQATVYCREDQPDNPVTEQLNRMPAHYTVAVCVADEDPFPVMVFRDARQMIATFKHLLEDTSRRLCWECGSAERWLAFYAVVGEWRCAECKP